MARLSTVAKAAAYIGTSICFAISARADNYDSCVKAKTAVDRIEQCSSAIAASRNPKRLERAYLRRGNGYMELKRFAEASDDFSKLIAINPHVAGYYDNRAYARRSMGLLKDALIDVNAAIKLAPDYSFGYRSRGLLRADMGDFALATADLTLAIGIDPRNAGLLTERGKILRRTGRVDEAIADFSRALDINAGAAEALRERGLAQRQAGHLNAAVADLFVYARLHPDDQEVSRALEELEHANAAHQPTATPPRVSDSQSGGKHDSEKESMSGTGFFVSPRGHIATNAHVVEGCSQTQIVAGLSPPIQGRVVARDKQNDMAIVLAEAKPNNFAVLRVGVKIGEAIAAFGYPLTGLLSTGGNFTTGNVSAVAGLGDDTRFIQISTPVQPGNSGGPLVDQSGNVVGIVTSKLDAIQVAKVIDDVPQNVNFAIKATTLINFLDANGVTYSTAAAGQTLPPAEIAEKAKSISVLIRCEK